MSDMKDAFKKAGINVPKQQEDNRTARSAPPQVSVPVASVPQDYTSKAEQIIKTLRTTMGRDYQNFTTSKIRNILSMVNEIYNDVLTEPEDILSESIQNEIQYMKVRLVYECGREPRVIKPFVEKAELLPIIAGIGDSRIKFINFARYVEALVAYHRFHGGRD